LAASTGVIFCKWHADIDKLDDEDMQQSSLSNILQGIKMQQSIGGSRKLYTTTSTIFFGVVQTQTWCVVAFIKTTINLDATIQNIFQIYVQLD
jgi:hypothetical protein